MKLNLLTGMLCGALLVTPLSWAAAGTELSVTENDAIKSNLEQMVGQSVTLKLSSGEELGGKVAKVGPNAVQLSQLQGKEFFDAIVPLAKIDALIVRTKNS